MLATLARRGMPDVSGRLAAQLEADRSDAGEKMAIAVESIQPDPAIKTKWLQAVSNQASELGFSRQRIAMASLFPSNQGALTAEFLPQALAALHALGPNIDPYFASRFAINLLVPICTGESARSYSMAMEDTDSLSSASLLFLREAQQADEECGRLRNQMKSATEKR